MTLLIDQEAVLANCDMSRLIATIENGLREEAAGELEMPPRMNIRMTHGFLRVMPVAMNGSGFFGFKVFHTSTTGARYLVAVYEQEGGELLALVDGDYLTAARTGATAGVGAKYMAREDSPVVGVIGSGFEARTNLAAIAAVRNVERVLVYSPREARREQFAEETRERYGVEAVPVERPEMAVDGVDIAIVATNTLNAPDPIAFRGEWMRPGMHVSSIGATMPILRELDTASFARAERVVVDAAPVQMVEECGDVIAAVEDGVYGEPTALADVVAGVAAGRESRDEITLFKSVGTAMQDVLAALSVYESVTDGGGGSSFDLLHLKAFSQPTNLVQASDARRS